MGDNKPKSEIQKPVKNTLLSGASHGFPFESFQGSSLLIPLSQDSPSVLNDTVGDVNKLGTKELTHSENLSQIAEAVEMATIKDTLSPEEANNSSQGVNQGYSGLFSSFFGGSNQRKQEMEGDQIHQKNFNQPSLSSLPSNTRSSSPFVAHSNIQSFSPALQVPSTAGEKSQDKTSITSTGFLHSLDSSFSHIQSQSQQQNFKLTSANDGSLETSSFQKVELPKIPQVSNESNQPEQTEVQHFFNEESKSGSDLNFGTQPVAPNLGFESFYNSTPNFASIGSVLSKTQSAVELPVKDNNSPQPTNMPSFFNSPQSQSVQFFQTRAQSTDSFKPIQSSPLSASPALLTNPNLSSTAPPMSSEIASKNYRRDHHKRLAYAPVPGLTSNTVVSSSYFQPNENFSNSTLSSELVKQPLSGSISQPALNVSELSLNLNPATVNPTASVSSLHNFFSPQSFTPTTYTSQPFEGFTTSQNTGISSFSSTVSSSSNNDNLTSCFSPALSPATGSTYMVSSPAFHPPIMSTKEQPIPENLENPVERTPPMVIPASLNNLANLGTSGIIYRPAYHHWFFKIETKEPKEIWQPFSMTDSLALEQAFNSDTLTAETIIPTDGGRYDVNITNRTRTAVYWEEKPKTVRRCSWFYKSTTESRLHPYDENTAYNLEEEYKIAVTTNSWNRKVNLPSGEYVIMYGASSMALFQNTPQTPEGWEGEPDYSQNAPHRPKIIKRGVLDDFEIDDGESPTVDHLIFVVHGIGSVCDFKFRTVEEAVDGFRSKTLQLIRSHFRSLVEQGTVNRVEVLPVSWHKQLHGETTGVDNKLQTITLKSIPRLRHFTNDTLLDILFYTSPIYCQNIMQQVGREINTLFAKFKIRNPSFSGGVSLVGHSLGSLILFDMLCHQKPPSPRMENIKEEGKTSAVQHEVTTIVSPDKKKRSLSRTVSYVMGNAGTGQPFIEYPQLTFQPLSFFAMGSPIGMFVTVRGIDSLGLDFCLPTCSRFFNVFHPFDPVAYRIEALVNPDLAEKRPVLIPHHKGRKRMHLELKEKMAKVGADLKQRLVDSVRSTWNTVYQLTMFGRADDGLEQEVDKVIEKQLERQRIESVSQEINECDEPECNAGRLNKGRRIDYVLQEAPLESFNEYVSALTSHVIYWDSEDTMLLILKEIYGSMGIVPDTQQTGMQEDVGIPSPNFQNIPSSSASYGDPPAYGFK